MHHAQEIDVRNMACPVPVIKVGKSMNALNQGEVLKVSARGEGTVKDLTAYCSSSGNTLIQHVEDNDEQTFFIRKA